MINKGFQTKYDQAGENPAVKQRKQQADTLRCDGLLRLALAAPLSTPGAALRNADSQIEVLRKAAAEGVDLLVFPALSLSGIRNGDLFLQEDLLKDAQAALLQLAEANRLTGLTLISSLPLRAGSGLIAAAAVLRGAEIQAIIPLAPPRRDPAWRAFLPAERWAELPPCLNLNEERSVPLLDEGSFSLPEFASLEIHCSSESPESGRAPTGPGLEISFSFLSESVGRPQRSRELARSRSVEASSAFALISPGRGESGTEAIYSAYALIAEEGEVLAERPPFEERNSTFLTADIDVQLLTARAADRGLTHTSQPTLLDAHLLAFSDQALKARKKLRRPLSAKPFLPPENIRAERCEEIFNLCAQGLARRMQHTRSRKLLLGISGGLDSCLALLTSRRSLLLQSRPTEDLIAVSMPGPGSGHQGRDQAARLGQSAGADYREISISEAVALHLRDLGHKGDSKDTTYENAQARERTQLLMDLSNMENGLLVGTGDLSEAALGWCTYNGDQMSMYNVNAEIPKTLVRCLCQYEAERLARQNGELASVILDILATPVSPELVPGENGGIGQKTEDILGPYELHDFFLWHFLKNHASVGKIRRLALVAFTDLYSAELIEKSLRLFLRRFCSSQFKRSASPEGAGLGLLSLSPRQGLFMPSDFDSAALLHKLEEDREIYA